jgi:hypothetical protein
MGGVAATNLQRILDANPDLEGGGLRVGAEITLPAIGGTRPEGSSGDGPAAATEDELPRLARWFCR